MILNAEFELADIRPRRYRPQLAVNYKPEAWRPIYDRVGRYAYALNCPQAGNATLGKLMERPEFAGMSDDRRVYNRNEIELRLKIDGLEYHGDLLPVEGHIIGIFSNGQKLAFLRRDSNNRWSYLPDAERAHCGKNFLPTQLDESGRPITDIFKADLGKFTEFMGFASIPYRGVLYYKRETLTNKELRPFSRATPAQIKLGQQLDY